MAADPLGTDLAFTSDLAINPAGDFDTISGVANVKQAVLRRILTIPGTIIHRPSYGCGILGFQNAPMTLAVRRQISQRIATGLPADPRIKDVTGVSVSSEDGTPSQLVITVSLNIVGLGAQTFTYTPFNGLVV